MKLNKKILTASLVGLSVLSLAACGNSTKASKADSESNEKTTISYWHVNAETQGGQSVEKLVEAFNAQSDTVEVIAKYNPDMYKGLLQNFQAEVASGNAPELIQVGWSFLEYFSENFEYVTPNEVIENYFPEDSTFLEDNFLPNILELAQESEGKQVGLPYSLSTPVLYINKDMLAQAGLNTDGPKTWEEVVEFAGTIKDTTGKYGLYIQEPADNWATQALLESNGATMITDGKASFASQEGIEAYEAHAKLVNENKALHISWDEGVKSFIDGEIGMLYTTIARSTSILNGAAFDVATVVSPEWEGEEKRIPAGGAFLAITATEEAEQKAAWEFQKFLYTADSVKEWSLGTGYVPATQSFEGEALDDILEVNKLMQAAINQMESVVPWASFPGDSGLEAEQILLDVRDQILGGKVSAEEGLTRAQESINNLLK